MLTKTYRTYEGAKWHDPIRTLMPDGSVEIVMMEFESDYPSTEVTVSNFLDRNPALRLRPIVDDPWPSIPKYGFYEEVEVGERYVGITDQQDNIFIPSSILDVFRKANPDVEIMDRLTGGTLE